MAVEDSPHEYEPDGEVGPGVDVMPDCKVCGRPYRSYLHA